MGTLCHAESVALMSIAQHDVPKENGQAKEVTVEVLSRSTRPKADAPMAGGPGMGWSTIERRQLLQRKVLAHLFSNRWGVLVNAT